MSAKKKKLARTGTFHNNVVHINQYLPEKEKRSWFTLVMRETYLLTLWMGRKNIILKHWNPGIDQNHHWV